MPKKTIAEKLSASRLKFRLAKLKPAVIRRLENKHLEEDTAELERLLKRYGRDQELTRLTRQRLKTKIKDEGKDDKKDDRKKG